METAAASLGGVGRELLAATADAAYNMTGDAGGHEAGGYHIPFTFEELLLLCTTLWIIYLFGRIAGFLGLPELIGHLVAGILVGPHGVAIAPKPDALMLAGELGLVLMVMEAGMEVDLQQLRVRPSLLPRAAPDLRPPAEPSLHHRNPDASGWPRRQRGQDRSPLFDVYRRIPAVRRCFLPAIGPKLDRLSAQRGSASERAPCRGGSAARIDPLPHPPPPHKHPLFAHPHSHQDLYQVTDTLVSRRQIVGARGVCVAFVGSLLPLAIGTGVAYGIFKLAIREALAVGASLAPTSMGISLKVRLHDAPRARRCPLSGFSERLGSQLTP